MSGRLEYPALLFRIRGGSIQYRAVLVGVTGASELFISVVVVELDRDPTPEGVTYVNSRCWDNGSVRAAC